MNAGVPWNRSCLLGLEELTAGEITTILDTARSFRKTMDRSVKKLPSLRGKVVANLFLEPSTRTRVAFEVAANRLSADVLTVSGESSSIVKGETLRDTAQNIQALGADLIVIRHSAAGSAHYLSKVVDIPVVNAGDGAHEHPTQGLLDAFTLVEHFGSLAGKRVVILGDILFSRVARSNIWALTKLGASVTVVGPSTLVPETFAIFGVEVSHNLREALTDADAVMLLRIQHERQSRSHFPSLGEYSSLFGLNEARSTWLKDDAIIMHPGPINRGVEIDSELADSGRSVILAQVTNGIAVRMAVLFLCASATTEPIAELT